MAKKKKDSRTINALSPKGLLKRHVISRKVAFYLRDYLLIILFIQAAVLVAILYFASIKLNEKVALRTSRVKEFKYWSSVVGQFPNKPDILFNAAKSAYESGEKAKAIEFLERALQIDPLFEKAQKFLKEIAK